MNHQQEMNEISEIQENLDKLSAETIDEMIQYLNSNAELLLIDKISLSRFLHIIQASINARPCAYIQYSKILAAYKELIKKFFRSDELYLIFKQSKAALLTLLELNLFNVSSLLKSNPHDEDLHFYFAPEILQYTQQVYGDSKRKFPVRDFENYIYNTMNKEEHIQVRSQLSNPDPLSTCIRNNDLNSLQEIESANPTVLDSKIPYSFYESIGFINIPMIYAHLTLPEFAAFFGSVNIFQYLMSKVDLTKFRSQFAVAGGNFEIIHILEDSHVQFNTSECLSVAIQFHQTDVVHYIHETLGVAYNKESILSCIKSNNLLIFSEVLNELKLNQDILTSAAELAVNCGNYDMTKWIFDLFQAQTLIPDDELLIKILNSACENGYLDIIKYLIEVQNAPYTSGQFTGLYLSSKYGLLETVTYLCSLTNININFEDKITQNIPIEIAAYYGHLDVVKFLASQNGVNLKHHLAYNNRTIAYRAAEGEHFDVLKFVCQICDDEMIYCRDNSNWNLLAVASQYDCPDIARFLIEQKGFNVNEPSHKPMFSAIQNKCINVVKYFLTLPNCDLVNFDNGWTAIHVASYYQINDILQLLIDTKKIDINAKANDGRTALIMTAMTRNMETIKILLDNGADAEITDDKNMKAIQYLSPDKQQIFESMIKK